MRRFLEDVPAFEVALREYPRQGNAMVLACLDELLDGIAADIDPPELLQQESMGSYDPDG